MIKALVAMYALQKNLQNHIILYDIDGKQSSVNSFSSSLFSSRYFAIKKESALVKWPAHHSRISCSTYGPFSSIWFKQQTRMAGRPIPYLYKWFRVHWNSTFRNNCIISWDKLLNRSIVSVKRKCPVRESGQVKAFGTKQFHQWNILTETFN